jgi:hypothetical protein
MTVADLWYSDPDGTWHNAHLEEHGGSTVMITLCGAETSPMGEPRQFFWLSAVDRCPVCTERAIGN